MRLLLFIHTMDFLLELQKIVEKKTELGKLRTATNYDAACRSLAGFLLLRNGHAALPMKEVTIETHQGVAKTKVISGRKLAFVPILRAGLGLIDGVYSVYIYDSGIEFEIETLINLGNKPSTTHADDGGTGMGFMNTFDTLRKSKASLIIEEYGKPSKDNFTKVIKIIFDNKNEYKLSSYCENEIQNLDEEQ